VQSERAVEIDAQQNIAAISIAVQVEASRATEVRTEGYLVANEVLKLNSNAWAARVRRTGSRLNYVFDQLKKS
jgi:hypothetical protein